MLYPRWRDDFDVVNLHWQSSDLEEYEPEADRLEHIMKAFDPRVIIALGAQTFNELGGDKKTAWLWSQSIFYSAIGRWCSVVKFPHPSGRNRWWNDTQNQIAAEDLLKFVVEDSLTAMTHIPSLPVGTVFPKVHAPRGGITYHRSATFRELPNGNWQEVEGVASLKIDGVEISSSISVDWRELLISGIVR